MIIDYQGYELVAKLGGVIGAVIHSNDEVAVILKPDKTVEPWTWRQMAEQNTLLAQPKQKNNEVTNGEDAEADQPDKG